MSVKFSFARISCAYQINRARESRDSMFAMIQLALDGFPSWKSGRNRIRNFSHPSKAHKYLNKLLAGGWLSEEEFCLASLAVTDLEHEFAKMTKFIGTTLFIGSNLSLAHKPSWHDELPSTCTKHAD